MLGLVGTETELVLLEHYDEPWQFVPLCLIAFALAAIVWHTARGGAASLRTLQTIMALFLVAGCIGLVLHFRGAAEFQLEIDPAMGKWALVKKVMQAKVPPVLAPGIMLQLGLLGLTYSLTETGDRRSDMS